MNILCHRSKLYFPGDNLEFEVRSQISKNRWPLIEFAPILTHADDNHTALGAYKGKPANPMNGGFFCFQRIVLQSYRFTQFRQEFRPQFIHVSLLEGLSMNKQE
ncbi:MAG: hypothetical protein AMS17_07265 [Spirochaetes bacterium DG_61]|nr:MAG: hypothetical protein AMS17_07265 [Spirochaetes bacterium DG_61]